MEGLWNLRSGREGYHWITNIRPIWWHLENQTNETTALDSEYQMMYVSEPSFDDDESEEESNLVDRDGNCFDLFEGEESESEEED